MADGKWKKAAKHRRLTIFHFPLAMKDAFFSILLGGA
jgi:hypothetical protein